MITTHIHSHRITPKYIGALDNLLAAKNSLRVTNQYMRRKGADRGQTTKHILNQISTQFLY